MWVDGNPTVYTNWISGAPNEFDGSRNCVVMYNNGFWDDINCNFVHSQLGYICKYKQGKWQ